MWSASARREVGAGTHGGGRQLRARRLAAALPCSGSGWLRAGWVSLLSPVGAEAVVVGRAAAAVCLRRRTRSRPKSRRRDRFTDRRKQRRRPSCLYGHATDQTAGTVTYSLKAGADASAFSINADQRRGDVDREPGLRS